MSVTDPKVIRTAVIVNPVNSNPYQPFDRLALFTEDGLPWVPDESSRGVAIVNSTDELVPRAQLKVLLTDDGEFSDFEVVIS